jgi:hypothetical protein
MNSLVGPASQIPRDCSAAFDDMRETKNIKENGIIQRDLYEQRNRSSEAASGPCKSARMNTINAPNSQIQQNWTRLRTLATDALFEILKLPLQSLSPYRITNTERLK